MQNPIVLSNSSYFFKKILDNPSTLKRTVWRGKISELGLRGAPVAVQMSFGPKLERSATRICMSLCTTFGVFDLRGVARVKIFTFFNFVHDVLHDPDGLTLIYAPYLYEESLWVYNYMVL